MCHTVEDCVAEAARAVSALLPTAHQLLVLEVGAGTGGTAASVLPALRGACACYCFTDVSESFLRAAQPLFAQYPCVRYELLNIDADPRLQGFALHANDVLLATNVLHATPFMRNTLRSCALLLHSSGVLAVNALGAEKGVAALRAALLRCARASAVALLVALAPLVAAGGDEHRGAHVQLDPVGRRARRPRGQAQRSSEQVQL